MFLEILFLSMILLFSNWKVTMNSFLLIFIFLKSLLFLPKLSFFSMSIENSFIFFEKLGFILFLLTIFSVFMIFISNSLSVPLFFFLNKTLLLSLLLVFITSNLLFFYFMFEITIIPTIMMILIWGYQPERLQASFYFFFYTILASLPLLIFILLLFSKNKSNFMGFFYTANLSSFWWIVMILAFLVKFPMFFFHLWLPKAHVEAPLGGSMILAAVLLKLGGIGIFRMMMMMKTFTLSVSISSISIWGSVLTALICLQQSDMKAMIAYSSVAHMSFLVSSLFLGSETGLNGAVLMMFLHGLSSASLFMLAKMMYDITSSRSMVLSKGKLNVFPIFTLFWALIITMNMGIPPASSFWAELFLMFGFFFKSAIFSGLFFLMAFFTTVYSCFLMVNIHHGKLLSKYNPSQSFLKLNFIPMFIFSFLSFMLFLSPSIFLMS